MPDPDLPNLDESVLDELLATTEDDRAFVEELVHTYLSDTPALVEAVESAAAADDVAALVRPAHTIKSSSATVGAARLSALARELELAARSGALDASARDGLEQVRAEWTAASDALQAWLTREQRT